MESWKEHCADHEGLGHAFNIASNLEPMRQTQSTLCLKQVAKLFEDDLFFFKDLAEGAQREEDRLRKYFDNVKYYRDDLKTTCRLLGIPWHGTNTILCMPGNARQSATGVVADCSQAIHKIELPPVRLQGSSIFDVACPHLLYPRKPTAASYPTTS